jgi:hypothetical protein
MGPEKRKRGKRRGKKPAWFEQGKRHFEHGTNDIRNTMTHQFGCNEEKESNAHYQCCSQGLQPFLQQDSARRLSLRQSESWD